MAPLTPRIARFGLEEKKSEWYPNFMFSRNRFKKRKLCKLTVEKKEKAQKLFVPK